DRSEMLAHHYLCALDFARAAGQPTIELERRARLALREAGDRATALHAFRAATRFYAAAVELWPDGDLDGDELRLRYGRALIRSGSPGIARSHFNLGSTYANLGDLSRASEHYARGAEAARRSGEPSVVRWFEAEALYELYWRGDWDGALAAAAELTEGIAADSG